MKSSRAMLLAALVFVAPVIIADEPTGNGTTNTQTQQNPPVNPPAPQTPPANPSNTTTTEAPKTTEAGMLSKIGTFITAAVAFPFVTAPDFIAKNTLGKIAAMECLKGGNTAAVLNHTWTGRVSVYVATAAILWKLNQMYQNSQDDAGNDDQLFMEE